ncbi:hypothetical protein SAMN04515647_1532 [Cohaesibacter sp. ES.047]|nr:hypothetical protein SAMN04515647_1532 [Cohaesibacter sp. ES.047]
MPESETLIMVLNAQGYGWFQKFLRKIFAISRNLWRWVRIGLSSNGTNVIAKTKEIAPWL